jgi:PTS system mannose-specific IIA component
MVGAVILTHTFIARELIATAEYIVGKIEGIVAVSIDFKMDAIEARKIISTAIKQVDQGQGVLVLTDLFGGSPSNMVFSFLDRDRIEVITGVNLPMILTFWNRRKEMGLRELAKSIQLSGTRSIARAKDLLETQCTSRKGLPVPRIQRR